MERVLNGNGKKTINLTENGVTAYLLRKDRIEERSAGGGREEERKRNIAVYVTVTV
jgi:hypothetical protein